MIKPALLLVWPRHLDYPVCRWNLERFKDYFSSVWIAFSEHHREKDLSNFIKDKLPFCNFVDVVRTGSDWREDAVNQLLDKVQEEYVIFFEQDFLIGSNKFFDTVLSEPRDFVYYKEGERVHPAFALIKTELVKKTDRQFAAKFPDDHFDHFFRQIPNGVNIEDLGLVKREDFYHMNGLSQNYQNFLYDDPFYNPANFLYFNWKSLQFPNQHPEFLGLQQSIENKFGHTPKHTFMDNFFPA